jgi:hypothetical protein
MMLEGINEIKTGQFGWSTERRMLGKKEILFSLWFLHYQFNEGNSKLKKDRVSRAVLGDCNTNRNLRH